jgi:sporulation protein YlmC with PRC-barrel domain
MKKKFTIFLALLAALSMLLAACGPAEEVEETPGVTEPAFAPTEPLEATEPVMTIEPTEPLATEPVETVEATEAVTETEVVPPTGLVDPGRLSNWLDFDVFSAETDEQIGSVEDIVLDFDQEQVDYILVEVGGFLGIGSKTVAIPYDRLELQLAGEGEADDETAFIVQATEEELERAPEFDPDLLPELGEPAVDWDADIESFWVGGVTTTEETPVATEVGTEEPVATEAVTEEPGAAVEAELQGVILASDLLGMTIRNSDGDDIGQVEDVVVDPDTGEIQYLAISTNLEELDSNWVAVPPRGFSVNADEDVLVLNVSQDVLIGAPNFVADEFPDTTIEGWDADIETFWQTEIES